MKDKTIKIYDSTLRDGAQTKGVSFSIDDKLRILEILADIGVDYVEAGWPGANPIDTDFFNALPDLKKSKFVSFGMTKRPGRSISNDPGFNDLLSNKADAICFVAKSWDFHVEKALGCSLDENLTSITESVKEASKTHSEVS